MKKRIALALGLVLALATASWAATWNWDGNNNLFVAVTLPGTPVVGTSTGGAQANSPTLPAVSGKTNYVAGFQITGLGATSVTSVAVTLSDGTNTFNYTYQVPAGVTLASPQLIVHFASPIPASASNTAWTLTVPTFGSGNTAASANVWGYKN